MSIGSFLPPVSENFIDLSDERSISQLDEQQIFFLTFCMLRDIINLNEERSVTVINSVSNLG